MAPPPPPSPMPRNGANTAPVMPLLALAFAVVARVAPLAMVLSAGRPLIALSRTPIWTAARGRAEELARELMARELMATRCPKLAMPKRPGAPSGPTRTERLVAGPCVPPARRPRCRARPRADIVTSPPPLNRRLNDHCLKKSRIVAFSRSELHERGSRQRQLFAGAKVPARF